MHVDDTWERFRIQKLYLCNIISVTCNCFLYNNRYCSKTYHNQQDYDKWGKVLQLAPNKAQGCLWYPDKDIVQLQERRHDRREQREMLKVDGLCTRLYGLDGLGFGKV